MARDLAADASRSPAHQPDISPHPTELGTDSAGTTRLVHRLEEAGYVCRRPDPDDRRPDPDDRRPDPDDRRPDPDDRRPDPDDRRPDPDDRRATLVEAIEQGHALREHVERIWTHLEALTVGDPMPAERQATLDTLLRLAADVLATEPCPRRGRPATGRGLRPE